MGVSKDDVNISGVSKDNPFARFANRVALREQGLQDTAANALNMTSGLQSIATQTGMQGTINPEDIPSVAGLANTKATVNRGSELRESSTTKMVEGLPSYVKSYRNYLHWRYPSRYGLKKSGTNYNYSTDFQQAGGDFTDLTDPYAPPKFGT
jgi:hypothetical protein